MMKIEKQALEALREVAEDDDAFTTIISMTALYGLLAKSPDSTLPILPSGFMIMVLTHLFSRCVIQQEAIENLRNEIIKLRVEFMAKEGMDNA